MKKFSLLILIFTLSMSSKAGDSIPMHHFHVGIRSMKFVGFYLENGFTVEYSSKRIGEHKIQFGANFVTSSLGSALFSNGVSSTQMEFSIIKHFRHDRFFQPLVRINAGLAHASYGSSEFDALTRNGFLLSAELGLSYRIPLRRENVSLKAGFGYNLFTGDGKKGLSTVYPVYSQLSILYRLK